MNSTGLAQALGPYLDLSAIAIVGGGTLLSVVLRTELRDLVSAAVALRVLIRPRFRAEPLIDQIAALGRIAARHGVMSLDRSVVADPDVSAAVAAIVDGADPDRIQAIVRHARQARVERHLTAVDIWVSVAEVAPAMGMVGTLIGLVKMFVSMNDPTAIGDAMAVALLATLYGALIASLVAMPVAARLRRLARAEAFERCRIEAPLVAMAAREAPRHRDQTRKLDRAGDRAGDRTAA
jgi:chemotaxis protein MotA